MTDYTELEQRQFYRRLKVKQYDEAKRCPKCRNRNYVRKVDGTCLVCVMKMERKK
jgi:predicted nucleic-acid-binding Zn-ribbon protein